MGTATFDNRRFRTTREIILPVGVLVTPATDGRIGLVSVDGDEAVMGMQLSLEDAERIGLIRQLADGEA